MNEVTVSVNLEEYERVGAVARATVERIQSLNALAALACRQVAEMLAAMKPLIEWLAEQDRLLAEQDQLLAEPDQQPAGD